MTINIARSLCDDLRKDDLAQRCILRREIESLEQTGRLVDATELASLFAVTAEIQEIAMASGWHEEYLSLAAEFDRLVR